MRRVGHWPTALDDNGCPHRPHRPVSSPARRCAVTPAGRLPDSRTPGLGRTHHRDAWQECRCDEGAVDGRYRPREVHCCPGAGRSPISAASRQGQAPDPGRARLPGLRAPPSPIRRGRLRRLRRRGHRAAPGPHRRAVGRPAATRRRPSRRGGPLAGRPRRRPSPGPPRPGPCLLGMGVADEGRSHGAGRPSPPSRPRPTVHGHRLRPRPGGPPDPTDGRQRPPSRADWTGSPSSRRRAPPGVLLRAARAGRP